MTSPRSVLVVDDQTPFRSAARAVLRRLEGFEFAGEASSGPEAIELVDRLHPALVLVDINMPEMSGIEATRQITAAHPDVVVILCSSYDGASAGLCLYPDPYSYRYGNHQIGTGGPVLPCAATGMAPPARLPEVAWRAGLDLNRSTSPTPRTSRGLTRSSGPSTRTAAPGCGPLPPWSPPSRPCSSTATW